MLLTIDIYYINNSDKLNLYIIYVSKDGYFHEYQKSITLPADELYIYQEYIAQKKLGNILTHNLNPLIKIDLNKIIKIHHFDIPNAHLSAHLIACDIEKYFMKLNIRGKKKIYYSCDKSFISKNHGLLLENEKITKLNKETHFKRSKLLCSRPTNKSPQEKQLIIKQPFTGPNSDLSDPKKILKNKFEDNLLQVQSYIYYNTDTKNSSFITIDETEEIKHFNNSLKYRKIYEISSNIRENLKKEFEEIMITQDLLKASAYNLEENAYNLEGNLMIGDYLSNLLDDLD